MKNPLHLLATLGLAVALAGCGAEEPTPQKSPAPEADLGEGSSDPEAFTLPPLPKTDTPESGSATN